MRHVVSIFTALALVAGVAFTAAAQPATTAASSRPAEYLALGDSLAFGFSMLVADPTNPDNYTGYPNLVAAALTDELTNASCPGETTSHFVNLAGSDNGCGSWRFINGLPLHASYSTTQLAFVDSFLQSHPKTLLITIDIGTNDLLALVSSCGGGTNVNCILAGLPLLLTTVGANLDTIYGHIRNVDGYRHKLVAVTVNSRNYSNPLETGVISQVNAVLADRTLAWGGIVADGFGAFAAASAAFGGDTCAAGLETVLSQSPLVCDLHPSPAGHALYAQAIIQALRPN
jgi:lysophospholipase L1-like esterase